MFDRGQTLLGTVIRTRYASKSVIGATVALIKPTFSCGFFNLGVVYHGNRKGTKGIDKLCYCMKLGAWWSRRGYLSQAHSKIAGMQIPPISMGFFFPLFAL